MRNIPPRPWRLRTHPDLPGFSACFDRNGEPVVFTAPNVDTADLIVRLANAEAEIVAALEGCLAAMSRVPFARMTDEGVQCGGCGAVGQSGCAADCWALGLDDACDKANETLMKLQPVEIR